VQASRDLDVGDVDPGVPPAAAGVSMAPVQAKKRGRLRVAETQPDVTLQVGGLAVVPKLNVPPEQAKRMRLCDVTKRSGYASTFTHVGLGTAISPNQVLMHPSNGPSFGNVRSINIRDHLTKEIRCAVNPSETNFKRVNAFGASLNSGDYARRLKFIGDTTNIGGGVAYSGCPDPDTQMGSYSEPNRAVSCWSFVKVPFDRREAMRLEQKSGGKYGLFWPDKLTAALDTYARASVENRIIHKFSTRMNAHKYKYLTGSAAPAAGTGINGDFFLDTALNNLYGPKTAGGGWGAVVAAGITTDAAAFTKIDELCVAAGTASPVMYPTKKEVQNGTYSSVIVVVDAANVSASATVNAAWKSVAQLTGDLAIKGRAIVPAAWRTVQKNPLGYDETTGYTINPGNPVWSVADGVEIGRRMAEECRASPPDANWPHYNPGWAPSIAAATPATATDVEYMRANYPHMLNGGPSTNALGGASYRPFAKYATDARFLETGHIKDFIDTKVPPTLMHYDTQGPSSYRFSDLDAVHGYKDGVHHERIIAERIWENVRKEGRVYACTLPIREASYVQPDTGTVTAEVYRPATCYKISGPETSDVDPGDNTSLIMRTDKDFRDQIAKDKLYYNFYGSVIWRRTSPPDPAKLSARFVACTAQDRAFAVFGAARIDEVTGDDMKEPTNANGYFNDWDDSGSYGPVVGTPYSNDRATGIEAPYINTARQPPEYREEWAGVRPWNRYFNGFNNARTVNSAKTYGDGTTATDINLVPYGEVFKADAANVVYEGWTPKVLGPDERNMLRRGENVLVAWPYEVPTKTRNSCEYDGKQYSALWYLVPVESCNAATSSGGISSLMSVFTPFHWCHKPASLAIAFSK
jgi:hypothetical protein